MTNEDKWHIVFALPNLKIDKAYENDLLAIAPPNDPRVKAIAKNHPDVTKFINNFYDSFGRKTRPSLMLIKSDAPDTIKTIEAVFGFRDALAICSVITGWSHILRVPHAKNVLYSSYFDFYPITLADDHQNLVLKSDAILGLDDINKFRGCVDPKLPGGSVHCEPDECLFQLILKYWNQRFVKNRKVWKSRVLFRSLNIAYHALALPFNHIPTIYDYGVKLSLWVSAFEILSHPKKGDASFSTVKSMLDQHKWVIQKLKHKRFIIYKNKKRVNLASKLYKMIYNGRNKFLHGNKIYSSRPLFPRTNNKKWSLLAYAPLLYRIALVSSLTNNRTPKAPDLSAPEDLANYISNTKWNKGVEEALATALQKK